MSSLGQTQHCCRRRSNPLEMDLAPGGKLLRDIPSFIWEQNPRSCTLSAHELVGLRRRPKTHPVPEPVIASVARDITEPLFLLAPMPFCLKKGLRWSCGLMGSRQLWFSQFVLHEKTNGSFGYTWLAGYQLDLKISRNKLFSELG
jgi:hypothetical protein